jgi:TetR/AcrR family transcriptional regulator, transcriptional repressor for nem operon
MTSSSIPASGVTVPSPNTSAGHAGAGPGRPREFCEVAALNAALEVFWQRGYDATTLDELTEAMGLSRSSFYSCFKSKHQTLLAAVHYYCDSNFGRLQSLTAGREPHDNIRLIVRAMADPQGGRRGCFLVNCISALSPHDPEVAAIGHYQMVRIEALIAGQFSQAGLSAALAAAKARALLSLSMGATMLRKAGADAGQINAMLSAAEPLIVSTT